jgi:hypothetical protein
LNFLVTPYQLWQLHPPEQKVTLLLLVEGLYEETVYQETRKIYTAVLQVSITEH